jgi:succinyl-CoA:acetate CoA-transferase
MMEVYERIKCGDLLNVVSSDPFEIVKKHIPKKGTIACSGMAGMGLPKVFPAFFNKYIEEKNEEFKLNIYTSGSAAPEFDESLARINVINRRYVYQNNPTIREKINNGMIHYYDIWLGEFSRQLKYGFLDNVCGSIDIALIEAVKINEDGSIIASLSLDNIPLYVQLAKKIIIELNTTKPSEIEGIHDIYFPQPRSPIPITMVNQRIGTSYIPCDPKKILAIIHSEAPEKEIFYGKPTVIEERIVDNLFNFLLDEVKKGRIPKNLYPLQTGIGPIGDTIATKLIESGFSDLEIWTEVAQTGYLDALDSGKVKSLSASAFMIPSKDKKHEERFIENISEYKKSIVLRPLEITNNQELIARFNVIAMNQAIEVDIYGNVNITHVFGSNIANGVGGSGEFARAAYLSIFLLSSTTKDNKISRIVPMTTHVDVTDHDVDVIVTEYGWADLRGLSPRERAKEIIEKCSSPEYKDELWKYFDEACRKVGGHMPHILSKAFSFHERFIKTGSMK